MFILRITCVFADRRTSILENVAENCPSGIQSLLATSNLKIQQNVELIKSK